MDSVNWVEDKVPMGAEGCTRCELHQQRTRIIWGEGNPQAKIVVVLDNPGSREDEYGHPFVCPTRQTLRQAASRVGLGECDLYITYILKCRPKAKISKGNCVGNMHRISATAAGSA